MGESEKGELRAMEARGRAMAAQGRGQDSEEKDEGLEQGRWAF